MAKLFELGQIVMTPGAADAVGPIEMITCLGRHAAGDWGSTSPEDKKTNDKAVKHGDRILSAYSINPSLPCKRYGRNTLWIITEADRSVTTLLLPDEY